MTFDPKEVLLGIFLAWYFVNSKNSNPYGTRLGVRRWLAFDCCVMEKAQAKVSRSSVISKKRGNYRDAAMLAIADDPTCQSLRFILLAL